jgi:hypothetical protein
VSRFFEWGDDPEAPGLLECELWETGEPDGEPFIVYSEGSMPVDVDRSAVERRFLESDTEPYEQDIRNLELESSE